MPRPSRREHIVDAAELLVRRRGFHGFSIRDAAEVVGVRSAAVHYHFPTKEDLVEAVAARYSTRFFEWLGDPSSADAIERLVAGFRTSLITAGAACLCGVLAMEIEALPEGPSAQTRSFFAGLVDWTGQALGPDSHDRAIALVSLLEGAMLLARARDGVDSFDAAVRAALPAMTTSTS